MGCSGGGGNSGTATPSVDPQLPKAVQVTEYAAMGDLTNVKALVESDSKLVNARDSMRRTALHRAAFNGHKNIVQYLLDQGANPSATDNAGQTAGEAAREGVHIDIGKIIDQAAADKAQKKSQ